MLASSPHQLLGVSLLLVGLLTETTLGVRGKRDSGLKHKLSSLSTKPDVTESAACTDSTMLSARFLAFPGKKASNLTDLLKKNFCPVGHFHAVHNSMEDLQKWEDEDWISDYIRQFPRKTQLKYASVHRSVRGMWQAFADSQSEIGAFFEEDAELRYDFSERYAATLRAISGSDVDIVYLGHCDEYCQTGGVSVGGDTTVVDSTYPNCAHSYLLSKKGARVLLDETQVMSDLYDNTMREACRVGSLRCMSVCPRLVGQSATKPGDFDYDHAPISPRMATFMSFYQANIVNGTRMRLYLAMLLSFIIASSIVAKCVLVHHSFERKD